MQQEQRKRNRHQVHGVFDVELILSQGLFTNESVTLKVLDFSMAGLALIVPNAMTQPGEPEREGEDEIPPLVRQGGEYILDLICCQALPEIPGRISSVPCRVVNIRPYHRAGYQLVGMLFTYKEKLRQKKIDKLRGVLGRLDGVLSKWNSGK